MEKQRNKKLRTVTSPNAIVRPHAFVGRPEDRLLVCCARTHLDSERECLVRELLEQPIDWNYLIERAVTHRVMPLLYRSLESTVREQVPADVFNHLRLLFLENLTKNLLLTRTMLEIFELLDVHGVKAVPFKGPVLAAFAYGSISLRQFVDVDILVQKQDALKAKNLICSVGYSDQLPPEGNFEDAYLRYQRHFSLFSNAHGTVVELHWTFEPGHEWPRHGSNNLWTRLETLSVDGKTVPSLSREDLLVYLCIHGSSSYWGHMIWICDVAELVMRCPDIDWSQVLELARRLHRRRMLFLGLSLVHEVIGTPLPHDILKMAQSYPGVSELVEQVQERIFVHCETSLGLEKRFSFRFKCRESLTDKVRFCIRRAMIPDARDFQVLRLPPYFLFLYFVIRPIRLLAEHVPHALKASWRND